MTDPTRRIDRARPVPPARGPKRERPIPEAAVPPVAGATFDGIPASPPDEVLEQIDAARGQLDALHARGAAVEFETGADSRVRAVLVEADGTRRELAASELFDVVAGRGTDPAAGSSTVADDDPDDAPAPHFDGKA